MSKLRVPYHALDAVEKVKILENEINALIDVINTKPHPWTNVTDDLPKKTGAYIVCIDNPDPHMLSEERAISYRVSIEFFIAGNKKFSCFKDITHWMPKPLPPPPDHDDTHYLIIGGYIKEPIGCTWGQGGQEDVLSEEPLATFEEVNKKDCPICGEYK